MHVRFIELPSLAVSFEREPSTSKRNFGSREKKKRCAKSIYQDHTDVNVQWRRQPPRNGGTKEDRGSGNVGTKGDRKNLWDHALFTLGNALLTDRETPMFTAGGTLFKCNSTLKSSETVKILRFLMTNVANKAMSARYGSNEILVSTSHSDMSH